MTGAPKDHLRALKLATVVNLILLSVQAWTGDVVNLFAAFPSGVMNGMGAFFQSLQVSGPGPLALYHGVAGFLIVVLSIAITALSFGSKARSVRIVAILGLVAVLAAALGGYLFVFSSFLNNGYSAQMGGSFIAAYAMYFLVLYYSK